MQSKYLLGIATLVILFLAFLMVSRLKPIPRTTSIQLNTQPLTNQQQTTMKIESPAFGNNESIPSIYTCDGQNTSPELNFSGVPNNAQSLALIMDDPDVPKTLLPAGVFDHWLVWNMPADTTKIGQGEKPSGVIGNNGADKPGYTGPCPPDREHRYFFKLYALDSLLDLPQNATKTQLEQAMAGHILEQAKLMGRYDRKR